MSGYPPFWHAFHPLNFSHSLLTNLGVNTSQLNHSISHFAPPADSRPKRRKARLPRVVPDADELGPGPSGGAMDVGAWGRNWHETIILSGIEYQRQRVSVHSSTHIYATPAVQPS